MVKNGFIHKMRPFFTNPLLSILSYKALAACGDLVHTVWDRQLDFSVALEQAADSLSSIMSNDFPNIFM